MSGSGYNPYAAGSKVYNGGSSAPHYGRLGAGGYAERDKKYKAQKKRNAVLRRLKARQKKNYLSSDNLTPKGGM